MENGEWRMENEVKVESGKLIVANCECGRERAVMSVE